MTDKLKILDLFSGIGGFSLGLERTGGFETMAFCEIDQYCQKVLKKHWPDVPIHEDVRNLDYDGPVDVICGGYPCQPFSVAGERKGHEDDRHLWPAMFELVKKHRPAWVIGENVAGHVSMGLDSVLADLESENYECRAFIIPACGVDAKHRRDRLWIVGHAASEGFQDGRSPSMGQQGEIAELKRSGSQQAVSNPNKILHSGELDSRGNKNTARGSEGRDQCKGQAPHGERVRTEFSPSSETMANTSGAGCKEQHSSTITKEQGHSARGTVEGRSSARWPVEPGMGRVAHGVSKRVDRIKGLGNAVVPQIPEMIGHAILESYKQ